MPINVLIADDHAVVRDGLRAVLDADPGINVVGDAPDGQQALALAAELQPDVVILDIAMPLMDGLEVALRMPQTAPQARVVMLSMSGSAEQVFGALQAGALGFLLKESAGREVMRAVKACHAGEYYLSPPVISTLVADYLQRRRQPVPAGALLELLSEREREILPLVAAGQSSAAIARTLYLSPKTVETYRSRMRRKLGLSDLAALVRFAMDNGLVE